MHFTTHDLGFTWCPFGEETDGGTEAAWSTTPAQKRSRMRHWLMNCLPHRFAGLRKAWYKRSCVRLLTRTLLLAYRWMLSAEAYGSEVVAYDVRWGWACLPRARLDDGDPLPATCTPGIFVADRWGQRVVPTKWWCDGKWPVLPRIYRNSDTHFPS